VLGFGATNPMAINPVVAGYDAVYAGLTRSPTLPRIWREHVLGPEYPIGFEHLSFLTFTELQRMASDLRPARGGVLVDLGCGGGGPALWIVSGSTGRLVGIDASHFGIRRAHDRARDRGLAAVSGFITAGFEQLAIRSESAEAVMSVDALQYAANKLATFVEAARTLRPGGRLMFTAFEVNSAAVTGVPVLGRDPVSDFRPLLEAAGFEVAHYEETADWMRRVTRTYEAVRGALPVLSQELGSAAATALAVEVSLTLERAMYRRRILAAAVRR